MKIFYLSVTLLVLSLFSPETLQARQDTQPASGTLLHDNSASALHRIQPDTEKNTPKNDKKPPTVLRIGTDRWPPFREIRNGIVTGIDDDLWQALSSRLGFDVEYVQCPWKRCLSLMQTGEIDAMSGLAWEHERSRFVRYIKPAYFQCSARFYVRTGEQFRLQEERQLKELSIGMVRGSVYYPRFDLNERLNKIPLTQEAALLPLLAEGRIDTYIGTDCQADFELANSQWYDQLMKAPFNPEHYTPLHLGLSRNSPWHKQADTFSRAVQEILDAGFRQQTLERYYRNITRPQKN